MPGTWAWPVEGKTILDAYPDFGTWAQSMGTSHVDWYRANVVSANLWNH